MIDLKSVWLPQIERYAALIADDAALRRSWIDGVRSETSAIDFGELLVQIFDDLDSDRMLEQALKEVEDQEYRTRLKQFFAALLDVERKLPSPASSTDVLASTEWNAARQAAELLHSYVRSGKDA